MTSKPCDPVLREQIRQRMSPPNRESVAEIARATGITSQTLYNWRSQWKKQGQLVPSQKFMMKVSGTSPGLNPPLQSTATVSWLTVESPREPPPAPEAGLIQSQAELSA